MTEAPRAQPAAERSLADRYEVSRVIRRGRGVETLLGVDLRTGAEVVIKATSISTLSPVARMRLEHEADVLSRVASATLAPVLDLGQDGDDLFMVMPRIAGVTLQERLQCGALTLTDSLVVARALLDALTEVHGQGVLHRDIKPANVIVGCDPGGAIERAVLIDFGFARSERLDPVLRDQPVGTAQYVSPEQAGVLNQPVDERSDLYSVGVLLFECLSGRVPFLASTIGELLREHLTAPAPRLRGLGVQVPRAMAEVVQRLLLKDPRDRYQSAAAALADVEEIAQALSSGDTDPAVVVGLHDRRRTLTEPSFVGRAEELRSLMQQLDAAAGGAPRLVTLEAESGGGKTRLLDEFALEARRRGAAVFRGQGTNQAAQRPLQLLEEVATGVAATAGADPTRARDLCDRLGEEAPAIAEALPVLRSLMTGATAAELPEAYGENRTLQALCVFLDALGVSGRPAVVILDDCQWADELTVDLLGRWWRRAAGAPDRPVHLLAIAAYRSEEVGEGAPLRQLRCSAQLHLAHFQRHDVQQLVTSMAGAVPVEAVDLVARLSSGSPLMAAAVLRGLVESEALVDDTDGWTLDPDATADLSTSRRAAVVLVRRLGLLPPPTLGLLSVAAVLGKEFDVRIAVELAGQPSTEAIPALDDARHRHLVWLDEQNGRGAFVHDKIREALLDRLTSEERSALHRAAADRLERLGEDRVFELAYHLDAAGEAQRALPYALEAGQRSRAQHALQLAEQQFRIAERALPGADDAVRRQVASGLGDVLMLRGAYEEAARCFEEVLVLSSGALEQAAIRGRLGELAFKRGDMRTAGDECEKALQFLGRRTTHNGPALVLQLLWELLVQTAHTLLPRLLVGRRSADGAEAELLAARQYSRLAYTYWFRAGRVPCAWAHLRGMNLTERYAPTLERAQAYSEHAPVMTMAPWYARGITYAERSLGIRTDLGDLWGQGQSLSFAGVVLYAASRYRDSIDRCRQAVHRLERTGDRWEVNTARWHIAFAQYRLGDLREAVDTSRRVYEAGIEIGDWQASGISLGAWSKASGGRVPADIIARELERGSDDAHTRAELLQAEAVRLLHDGAAAEAVQVLEAARRLVRRAGLRQEYVAPIEPWLATCLRTQAERLPANAVAERSRLLRRARRVGRRAHRLSRHYRNNLPHALRERALIACLLGDEKRARRWLDESIAVAAAQEARAEEATSRLARATAGATLGWGIGDDERVEAEKELQSMSAGLGDGDAIAVEPQITLSLADRFTTVVDVGRRIAACGTRDAVFEAVHAAALALLRGDRCVVVDAENTNEDGTAVVISGSIDLGFSRTAANRALHTGRPVIVDLGTDSGVSESLELSSVRSALYAPIIVAGRPTACFAVFHSHVAGLFGEDEERLAEYIATLAGGALENAAGSEARFRSLVRHSTDVIAVVAADGAVRYLSPSVTRVFGYEPGDLVGGQLFDIVHPEDTDRLRDALARAATDIGVGAPVECRWRHRDSSWRHAETTANSRLDDPSVRGVVLNTRDVTERRRAEDTLRDHAERLSDIADRDPLTGLGNRRFFDRALDAPVTGPFAVLAIDIDNLKVINDLYGHEAGDAALRLVAPVVCGVLRDSDIVARVGGDEFGAFLPGVDLAGARSIAERMREAMYGVAVPNGQARISVGCAAGGPQASPRDVLRDADSALFRAKRGGRDRVATLRSGPGTPTEVPDLRHWETTLARILADGRVGAHYQPIVRLADGGTIGYEALARPSQLAPDAGVDSLFVTAQRLGVGRDLDWLCRRSAIQTWSHARPEILLFVNVGVLSLLDPLHDVDQMLLLTEWTGIDPRTVVLEVTEREAVPDLDRLRTVLASYRSHGFRFALDDLGDGHSTLAVLSAAEPEFLKLAGSVTRRVAESGPRYVVTAALAFAAASGAQVVAENLETCEDVEYMRELGVSLGQGYALGRPAPVEAIRRAETDTRDVIRRLAVGR